MYAELILSRLGNQIKTMRTRRGYSQLQLAKLAGTTRQKVAAIESGDGSVGVLYYGKVLAAMELELQAVPARRPVLEELQELFP